MSKGTKKYLKKKIFWFIITLIAAILLNFFLPRLMRGAGTQMRLDWDVRTAVAEELGYGPEGDLDKWNETYDRIAKEKGVYKDRSNGIDKFAAKED